MHVVYKLLLYPDHGERIGEDCCSYTYRRRACGEEFYDIRAAAYASETDDRYVYGLSDLPYHPERYRLYCRA